MDLEHTIDQSDDLEENAQDATPGRKSLRSLVNKHCRECCYDSESPGTWRAQTEACAVTKCALYPVRPVSKPKKVKSEPIEG